MVEPMTSFYRQILMHVTLITLCGQIAPVAASDSSGGFALKGVGATSCSEFVAAADQGGFALAQYFGYVAGYTSAVNELRLQTFDVWPWQTADTVLLLLREQCLRQPDVRFGAALATLTHYWFGDRVVSREELVRLGGPDSGILLYASTLERIKALLEQLGYRAADPYTALMQYKTERKVADSTNLMQMLLLRLLSEPTEESE